MKAPFASTGHCLERPTSTGQRWNITMNTLATKTTHNTRLLCMPKLLAPNALHRVQDIGLHRYLMQIWIGKVGTSNVRNTAQNRSGFSSFLPRERRRNSTPTRMVSLLVVCWPVILYKSVTMVDSL
jgi:hypothetical protein